MDDIAAKVINDAAARNTRVTFPESGLRNRDPFREIRVVELGIPPCPQHPHGHTYLVHPRQVAAHQRLYPGAWVKRTIVRKAKRRLNPTDVKPQGHVSGPEAFLHGRTLHGG